jgi:HAMP domain-containing protein
MRISNALLAMAAATLLITGCAQNRAPADKALDGIEASLKDVRDDAARYAPDGLKGVEAQLKRLRESYDAKEYGNVLAGAPALEKAVGSLKDAVESGKSQARKAVAAAKTEWEGLNTEVPKMVDTIQARVDTLSKGRLPFGLNKDEFEGAKSAFESMKETWKDATAQASQGDPVEATSKGKTAKGMGEAIYDQLKIKQT